MVVTLKLRGGQNIQGMMSPDVFSNVEFVFCGHLFKKLTCYHYFSRKNDHTNNSYYKIIIIIIIDIMKLPKENILNST